MDRPTAEGQDQQGRRWDDPPDSEPLATGPESPRNTTTMILVQRRQATLPLYRKEVLKIAFSPRDDKIVGMIPNHFEEWNVLYVLSAATFQVIYQTQMIKAETDFAFAPLPDDAIACPFFRLSPHHEDRYHRVRKPRLEIFDFRKNLCRLKSDVWIQAPMAFSPDGLLIAAISSRDKSRIVIMKSNSDSVLTGIVCVIPAHIDEVTHLCFTPDGTGVISLSKDGSCRLTSVASGRTLRKFEVEARRNPQMLQVSPDGQLIVSIWGREVMLWYPSTGIITTYSLTTVRQSEGWPLCISPDCKYLVCRTEDGLDLSDLKTGQFRGEFVMDRSFPTSAGFNSDSTWLVVGKHSGEVCLYELLVVS